MSHEESYVEALAEIRTLNAKLAKVSAINTARLIAAQDQSLLDLTRKLLTVIDAAHEAVAEEIVNRDAWKLRAETAEARVLDLREWKSNSLSNP
jgi:hypothetical protein